MGVGVALAVVFRRLAELVLDTGRRSRSSCRSSQACVPLTLHLGAVILEPELEVLGLETREALTVWRPVQLVRVLLDDVRRWVRVVCEPALQARDLRQRVDEDATALSGNTTCIGAATRGCRGNAQITPRLAVRSFASCVCTKSTFYRGYSLRMTSNLNLSVLN